MSSGIIASVKQEFLGDLEYGFRGAQDSSIDLCLHSLVKIIKTLVNTVVFAGQMIQDIGANLFDPKKLFERLKIKARTLQYALTNVVGTIIGIIPIINKIAFDHLLKKSVPAKTEPSQSNTVQLQEVTNRFQQKARALMVPEYLKGYI